MEIVGSVFYGGNCTVFGNGFRSRLVFVGLPWPSQVLHFLSLKVTRNAFWKRKRILENNILENTTAGSPEVFCPH